MYTGYELSKNSRDKLEKIFPPKYPDFIGHHITQKFGTKNPDDVPAEPEDVKVVGYADDGAGIEGLIVSIDGQTKRDDNSLYHITWSLDRSMGYKPVDTNKIVHKAKKLDNPVPIEVTPKLFEHKKSLRDIVESKKLTNL